MNDEEVTIFLEALRESEYNNTTMNDEESTIFWAALREKEYPFLAPLRESKLYSKSNNLYGVRHDPRVALKSSYKYFPY